MNKLLNDDIGKYRGDIGERIVQLIFERYGLLELKKIPRSKNKTEKTADFFVKKGAKIVAVCEVKSNADTRHPDDQRTGEELSEFIACHKKLKNFDVRDKNNLTPKESKEYNELKKKNMRHWVKEHENSTRLEKSYYRKIKKHFNKAMEQLSGYNNYPKILVFVSFDMTDFNDLKKFLGYRRSPNISMRFPDLCILLKVQEPIYQSGKIKVTETGFVRFTKQGEKLINNNLSFIKKLSLSLRLIIQ